MATYKEIFGKQIKVLASDPTDTGAEGQIWYNTTLDNFRTVLNSEAWSSGGHMATARGQVAMFGTQTSSVAAGGTPDGNATEEYNGTGWATGGDLNTTREGLHGAGVLTAGVIAGGFIQPSTYSDAAEEYDGSTWTSVTVSPYPVSNSTAFGTQAAAVFAGGDPGSKTTSLEYSTPGSWTAGGALTTGRAQSGGAGTLVAGAIFGGTPLVVVTEEYNGTAWTAGGDLPAGNQFQGGAGIQTAALSFGGMSAPTTMTTATNKYDGTSWTTAPALGTAQGRSQGSGTQALALIAGGNQPHTVAVGTTQEFNISTSVVTPGAYSSLPNLNTTRDPEGCSTKNGTTSAAATWTGSTPGFINNTEDFNGSTWSVSGVYPQSCRHVGGTGIETAGLGVGGFTGPANLSEVSEYNGSSWTGGGAYPVAQYSVSTAGTQGAAITAGGGSDTTPSNDYNGSSWTANPALSIGRSFVGSTGSQTASVVIGGSNAPVGQCEEFNGSAWVAGGNLATGHSNTTVSSCGTQIATAQIGCNSPSPTVFYGFQQAYDGTSWITGAALANGRQGGAASGTTTSHLIGGGFGPGSTYFNNTEEFTAETSALNYKTITTN